MKSKRRFVGIVLAAAIGIAATQPVESLEAAGKIKLSKKEVSLREGKTVTLKVIGTKKKAKWKTSNKKVAVVSTGGKVTAKKEGKCKIIAQVASKSYTCNVTVLKRQTDNSSVPTETASIVVKDVTVQNGDKTIFGKLYSPKEEGKYPTVILSHGYNGVNTDFVSECTYFAQNGYVAYAFDFCGGSTRSKSSGKSTDMTVFTEKEDLLAVFDYIQLLDNVDTERMFLFGGSQGGFVSTLAAEELKDKVKGMILYFPALNIPDDWRRNYATVEEIPDTVDFWGMELGKNFFLSIRDFYTFDNIGSYPNDVLIIYGDKDPIVPYDAMIKAKEAYDSLELVVLENEGHGFSASAAEKARQMVLSFMQKRS